MNHNNKLILLPFELTVNTSWYISNIVINLALHLEKYCVNYCQNTCMFANWGQKLYYFAGTSKKSCLGKRKAEANHELSDLEDGDEFQELQDSLKFVNADEDEFGQFRFTKQGVWVAVFYDNDFYVGEVAAVNSEFEGQVAFMERCKFKKSVFRWPDASSIETVDFKHVFASEFDVRPVQNGRRWEIPSLESLEILYQKYKMVYC